MSTEVYKNGYKPRKCAKNMTLSPDGNWFWNGTEWIPAPPGVKPETNQTLEVVNSGQSETTSTSTVQRPNEVQESLESVQEFCMFIDEYVLKNTSHDGTYKQVYGAYLLYVILGPLVSFGYLCFLVYAQSEPTIMEFAFLFVLYIIPLALGFKQQRRMVSHLDNVYDDGSKLVIGRKRLKMQRKSFLDNLAMYDFLVNAADSLNDLSLRKELITVQSTLEQMKDNIKSQDINNTIIKSAAAGAVAYGAAKSLTKK